MYFILQVQNKQWFIFVVTWSSFAVICSWSLFCSSILMLWLVKNFTSYIPFRTNTQAFRFNGKVSSIWWLWIRSLKWRYHVGYLFFSCLPLVLIVFGPALVRRCSLSQCLGSWFGVEFGGSWVALLDRMLYFVLQLDCRFIWLRCCCVVTWREDRYVVLRYNTLCGRWWFTHYRGNPSAPN
jgi:hypothetical protein